ncbi:MAG: hypothetical protein HY744_06800 [Deltaproteobacteria bacterium]|nr:hypothetical protein [Deltaproteobacteria bacterium]
MGATASSAPATSDSEPSLAALERAHGHVHLAARALEAAPPGPADTRPAARALEAATAAIYDAIDLRDDRLAATRRAAAELDRGRGALDLAVALDPVLAPPCEALRRAAASLAEAEPHLARRPPELPLGTEILRASRDTPRLHRLARPSLAPVWRVPDPTAPPPVAPAPPPVARTHAELAAAVAALRSQADEKLRAAEARRAANKKRRAARAAPELVAEPPPGFCPPPWPSLAPAGFVRAKARECFEELAMLGVQRAPVPGEPWRSVRVLEARLLAAIDALASLGGEALAAIEPLVRDAPAKDPSRGFAAALVLGCCEGRDALGVVDRLLRWMGPSDPEVARAFAGALALAPHPGLGSWLRVLCADPLPACRAIAVEILAYRELATTAELAGAALDPAPAVAAAALPPLGLARGPELDELCAHGWRHADASVREAAWKAGLLGGAARVLEALRAELGGPLAARAALPLAVGGDERDAADLLARTRHQPRAGLVAALGWAGLPEAVPLLVELLGHRDPELQLGAAEALDRLTGARLYEQVEVPPEQIEVPEVPEPGLGEPKPPRLARLVSDPRDLPADGANDTVVRPSSDPAIWLAWWRENEERFARDARYRRGRPYSPLVSLWEMDVLDLSIAERRWLQIELVVRTGGHVRFDPHDFVAVQEQALAAWQPVAERAATAPGSWSRPGRR